MTNKSFKQAPPVTRNLQRSFERAVRDIYQAGLTGEASQYRTPIVRRASLPASGPIEEKRALSDAAKALAQLWKVSHNPSR